MAGGGLGGRGVHLHTYIRNTPSDTEALAEQPLREAGASEHWKRIYRAMQNLVGQRK